MLQSIFEKVQGLLPSLRLDQDTFRAVLYPAAQLKTLCKPVDKRPEADPLDDAVDFDPEAFDRLLLMTKKPSVRGLVLMWLLTAAISFHMSQAYGPS